MRKRKEWNKVHVEIRAEGVRIYRKLTDMLQTGSSGRKDRRDGAEINGRWWVGLHAGGISCLVLITCAKSIVAD